MTIVFANELGGGQGHHVRLATVARVLSERDERMVLVAPGAGGRAAAPFDAGLDPPPRPRPRLPEGARLAPPVGLAGVLGQVGFGAPEVRARMTAAWDELIGPLAPSLIVTDAAPYCRLAVRGRVPVLTVGSGYGVPPVPGGVTEVLRGDATLACCWPEFDPREGRPDAERIGPLMDQRALAPSSPPRRAYAYFHREDETADGLIRLVEQQGVPVTRSDPDALLPPETIFGEHALLIHGGGLGLCVEALTRGTAQLIIPGHAEALWNAKVVAGFGGGAYLEEGRLDAAVIEAGLTRLLSAEETSARRDNASRLAARIAADPWMTIIRRAADELVSDFSQRFQGPDP